MSLLYFACIPGDQDTCNPRLVASAVAPSVFMRCAQVLTINSDLYATAEQQVAEYRGVLGAWVTPVLFIPPRALCDTKAQALAILECESADH